MTCTECAHRYSLDTSVLIESWNRLYPIDVFPSFWERLQKAIEDEVVIASVEVHLEIKKKDDELAKWVKERATLFHEIDDETQDCVSEIMARYPKLVDARTSKSAGDPWVIALAKSHDTPLVVVTHETPSGPEKPKIPYVCGSEGIRCITVLAFIRELGWKI